METIANRHSGTAGGALVAHDQGKPLNVHVSISASAASTAAGQRALWMLVNLLARSVGTVSRITVACPEAKLYPGVTPGYSAGSSLVVAVFESAKAIGAIPPMRTARAPEQSFVLGIGRVDDADVTLVFGDWWGGLAYTTSDAVTDVALPFGPYIAAAHAAGHVFRASRGLVEFVPFVYDAWKHVTASEIPPNPPPMPQMLAGNFLLAGVGAVGTATMLTLWATPGLEGTVQIADADTVDLTNLNRCVLFDASTIGLPKASTAAKVLQAGGSGSLTWDPHDGLAQEHPRRRQPLQLLLSAVDKNRSRLAIQRLIPAMALGASTYNLRSSLMRAGPPGAGACLMCHNPLEPEISDPELRGRYLAAGHETRARLAEALGVSRSELDSWARTARCGELDNRALPLLAGELDTQPHQFSVGYLSVLAGVLLAAEAVKERGSSTGGLDDDVNHVSIQTLSPWLPRNNATRYLRQEDCIFCGPAGSATLQSMWADRFSHR